MMAMQRELIENWSKICQSLIKPMLDIAELNIKTFNNLVKNTTNLDNLSQPKQPTDYILPLSKIATEAFQEAARYTQKAMEIGLCAISDASKTWIETVNKSTTNANDAIRSASSAAEGRNRE